MSNVELHHSGIKGMKWGIRRYQNKDGSLTPLGKKRYGILDSDEIKKQDAVSAEDAKKKAMTSGDVKQVAVNRHNMTNDEYRKALDRIDLERRLNQYTAGEKKSFMDKSLAAIDKLDKVRNAGEKLVNSYNLIAKINNSFNSKKMPTIDGQGKEAVDAFQKELLKSGSADDIVKNFGKFNSTQLNDAVTRLRNEETIKSYTSDAQAKKQRDEETRRASEESKRATQEAIRKTQENNVKASEANKKAAEANARKAEAEAKEAEERQAQAEEERKKKKENENK